MRKLAFLLMAVMIFSGMSCEEFDPTESTRIRGQLWRDFDEGRITEAEYKLKSGMLGELDDQWDAQVKRYKKIEGEDYFDTDCGGMTQIDPPSLGGGNVTERRRSNRAAMEDFRHRIILRGREIYDWDPDADKRTSMAVPSESDGPQAMPVSFGEDLGGEFASNDTALGRDIASGFNEGQVEQDHHEVY